jgi:hypothetical protein
MYCISCGFKNADEARFCMKCGAAIVTAGEKDATPVATPKPAGAAQPPQANAARPASTLKPRPATPPQPAPRSFDVDRFIASFAVGVGSLLLAFILADVGYHSMQNQTRACTAATISGGNQGACYSNGWYTYFLAAFAVAGGGLKMASRIGKR